MIKWPSNHVYCHADTTCHLGTLKICFDLLYVLHFSVEQP